LRFNDSTNLEICQQCFQMMGYSMSFSPSA
jgi:hypothetical protein